MSSRPLSPENENGLSAVLRPAPAYRKAFQILHGQEKTVSFQQGLDEAEAVLGLEGLLNRALEAHPDDRRAAAAFIVAEMKKAQRP